MPCSCFLSLQGSVVGGTNTVLKPKRYLDQWIKHQNQESMSGRLDEDITLNHPCAKAFNILVQRSIDLSETRYGYTPDWWLELTVSRSKNFYWYNETLELIEVYLLTT